MEESINLNRIPEKNRRYHHFDALFDTKTERNSIYVVECPEGYRLGYEDSDYLFHLGPLCATPEILYRKYETVIESYRKREEQARKELLFHQFDKVLGRDMASGGHKIWIAEITKEVKRVSEDSIVKAPEVLDEIKKGAELLGAYAMHKLQKRQETPHKRKERKEARKIKLE